MEQRRGGLAGHARIAVGAAGHHGLGHAEDAAHALDLVERGDEMHLRRAGIGETGIDAAGEQRAHKAFGTIHRSILFPNFLSVMAGPPKDQRRYFPNH